ncbi:4'-phosphopantetheinyl transferase superfamily [Crucibulum laeve]|uniref:holo-[acyl-carrier-protein] synthase n=1 Tax=Crucibulum laeve TaxID=68775 RepID=A0A5C3MD92_9AGAR|nr:4'-phosphopantetheinyl transferase superfamily [Crucibulum laeve]
MQAWAVVYNASLLSEELYQRALLLVDSDSVARIKKFYHRADACRTLIGRLLTRVMLKERGISVHAMKFSATSAGKPYITTNLKPPVGYNVTHDNALIALAFAPGIHNAPAFSIGIDVMKVRLPSRETFASFVDSVGEQLTPLEHRLLFSGASPTEGLRRFFWMWTLKEAYTKALGVGMGFNFQRVEFDVVRKVVRIDGKIPEGWRFNLFVIRDGDDLYQGVVAEYVGGMRTEVIDITSNPNWLVVYDAVTFVKKAIDQLQEK